MSTNPTQKNKDSTPSHPKHLGPSLPLIDHFRELRQRLVWCVGTFFAFFVVAYFFSGQIFTFFVKPLSQIASKEHHRLIYTGMAEGFTTYLKVAFYAAFSGSIPIIFYHIWRFLKPGLFLHEQNFVRALLLASPGLFLLGSAFAYYVIIPNAWAFFLRFEVPASAYNLPVVLEPRIYEYLSIMLQILFAFGLSFQLPIVLILMAKTGWVTVDGLCKNRKYAFLFILVAAACLTPPDVLSMLGLALPLYGLYEGSLLMIRYLFK